jgi:[acyl-carrier-protein] S-malonyltransferase
MQAACEKQPSTMAAILGLEDGKVEEICAQVAREAGKGRGGPGELQLPGQLVISANGGTR